MALHIFDLDNTLIKKAASISLLKEGIRDGSISFWPLIRLPLLMGLYKLGSLHYDVIEKELPFLNGISKKKIFDLGVKAFDKELRSSIFPEACQLLKEIKESGDEIILATSSFFCSVESIAGYLGFENIICSRLEFDKEDLCTGKTDGRPAFGKYKLNKVNEYLEENGIDPTSCHFYSDSSHDLPLLETVGIPVAVNPDRRLRRKALDRGWKILDFS